MTQCMGPRCHPQGITGYGNPDDGVMVIGIGPGFQEVKNGRPLVGPSGGLLDATLATVGWERSRVYCTNLLCYRPEDERGRDRDPSDDEIRGCYDRLAREILEFAPRVIITIGAIPTETLIPGRKVGAINGQVIWHDTFNCWVIPTYHPAAVLRGMSNLYPDIVRALAKIPDVVTWPNGYDVTECVVANDYTHAWSIISSIPDNAICALDIETGSPNIGEFEDPFLRPMLCFSLCWDSHTGYVIPANLFDGLNIQRPDVKWLFHNGPSDTAGIKARWNFDLPIDHDTMMLSYALDERPGYHTLKALAREYCRAGFWEEPLHAARNAWIDEGLTKWKQWYKRRTGHMQPKPGDPESAQNAFNYNRRVIKSVGFEVVRKDILYKYNAEDAVRTRQLFDVLARKVGLTVG